jgi:hypothetical protein
MHAVIYIGTEAHDMLEMIDEAVDRRMRGHDVNLCFWHKHGQVSRTIDNSVWPFNRKDV